MDKQERLIRILAEVLATAPNAWKKAELTKDQIAFMKKVGVDIRKTYVPQDSALYTDSGNKRKGIKALFGNKK